MATDTFRDNAAAYVLGVLDADETVAFENHLAGCDLCAAEVESLLPTALSLGEISPNQANVMHIIYSADPVEAAPPAVESGNGRPAAFPRLTAAVGSATAAVRRRLAPTRASHRRGPNARHGRPDPLAPRRRRQGLLAVTGAAGVVLAFMLGTQFSAGSDTPQGGPSQPATTSPEVPSTASLDVTDARTGVHAVLAIADAPWGSQLWLTLDKVRGPLRCELVAIGWNGSATPIATWRVPVPGYGIDEAPEPLTIQATTAALLRDVREFVIRAVPPDGGPYVLVTLAV